jgi:hypothetical protein
MMTTPDHRTKINQTKSREDTMITKKRILGIIIYTLLTFVVFLNIPTSSIAIGVPVSSLNIFGDDTVFIDVAVNNVGGDHWDFQYNVSNPGRDILYMSIGLADPLTVAEYINGGVTYPPLPDRYFDPVTSTSFFPYFNPMLAQGSNYEFTIHFHTDAIFEGGQGITVSALDGTMTSMIVYYEKPDNPGTGVAIPEPSTLLILGIGIISLGLWSIRRRRT